MNVREIKAAVRRRDGLCCARCGMTNEEHHRRYGKQLHVHRRIQGSAYSVQGCETLCYQCHGKEPRGEAAPGESFPFRPLHPGLKAALQAAIEDPSGPYYRRARNDVMNLILEDKLRELGHPAE